MTGYSLSLCICTCFKQSPSLDLELAYWPACNNNPPVSVPHSRGFTGACMAISDSYKILGIQTWVLTPT